MLAVLTHLVPMALGWLAKFMALKSADAKETQMMMLTALNAQAKQYKHAREFQTPSANGARRIILFFLMGLIGVFTLGFVAFDVPIFVEQVTVAQSYFFGIFTTPEVISWTKIEGIPAFDKVFVWMTVLIEFWFGAQLAKRG